MSAATPQDPNPVQGLGADPDTEHVAIGAVTGWPGNPRRGRVELIRQGLRRYGQYAPLIVQRSTGRVVKGNNTLAALHLEGYQRILVRYRDLDDREARRMALYDNRTTDLAEYDDLALAREVLALDGDYEGTGLDVHDVDEIAKALREAEPKALPTGPTAPQRSDRTRIIMCPDCGHSFDATSAVEVRRPQNAGGRS